MKHQAIRFQPRLSRSGLARVLLGLGLAALIGPTASGQTAPAVPRFTDVRLGFDGKYKVGDWTPVWVTLEGGAEDSTGRLEISALDGDGVTAIYVDEGAPPVQLAAGQETVVLRYIKFGRVRSTLTLRLRGESAVLAERTLRPEQFPQPLPSSRELLVTLGDEAGVTDAARQMRRRVDEQVVSALVSEASLLPDQWRGYESVDTLILPTGRPEFLNQLDGPRREALMQWVRLGGRILLSVGSQGETAFGEQGVLRDLAPGRYVDVVPQRRTGGLENFISAGERLGAGEGRAGDLLMTVLTGVRGRVEVAESSGPVQHPVIVKYPVGFGQATLIALDLDRGPIAAWNDRGKLVRRLIEGSAESRQAERDAGHGKVSHIGYTDLSGQLRAALDQFPGITPVAFSWVAALIVLYIALIGPLDYFFLRRFAGKMERTWITFPLVVILFCVTAWIGVRWSHADRLLVNQLELVDVDVESGLARGTAWTHVYSPAMQTWDLSLTPHTAVKAAEGPSGAALTWHGLPGAGLGGMNSTTGELFNAPYRITAQRKNGALQIEPRNMPIQIRSTRSLHSRWWSPVEIGEAGQLTASDDGLLTGEIANRLTVPLTDCLLAYNHWSYRAPRELAPGAKVRFERRLPDGNLVWRLTQKYVGEDYKEFSTPWNEASRDVPRVVEMLLWHEAAGGRNYTGLAHRHQADVDLSEHLRTGRAVLLGRVQEPAAQLTMNGQEPQDEANRRWTWYRVVYPVTSEN